MDALSSEVAAGAACVARHGGVGRKPVTAPRPSARPPVGAKPSLANGSRSGGKPPVCPKPVTKPRPSAVAIQGLGNSNVPATRSTAPVPPVAARAPTTRAAGDSFLSPVLGATSPPVTAAVATTGLVAEGQRNSLGRGAKTTAATEKVAGSGCVSSDESFADSMQRELDTELALLAEAMASSPGTGSANSSLGSSLSTSTSSSSNISSQQQQQQQARQLTPTSPRKRSGSNSTTTLARSRLDSVSKQADHTSMSEVRGWFAKLGLPQYADSFLSLGYDDLAMCGMLDDSDLLLCGVDDVCHRRRILQAAAAQSNSNDPDELPTSPEEVEVLIRDRSVTSEDVEARARESMAANDLSAIMEELCNIGSGGSGGRSTNAQTATQATANESNATFPSSRTTSGHGLTGDPDIDLDTLLYDLVKFDPQKEAQLGMSYSPEPASSENTLEKRPSNGSGASGGSHGNGGALSDPSKLLLNKKMSLPVMLGQATSEAEKKVISSMWESLGSVSQEQDIKQPTVVHTPAEAQKATMDVQRQIVALRQQLEGEAIWTEEEIAQKVKAEKLRIAMEHIKEARVAQGIIHTYSEDGTQRTLVASERMDAWTAAHQLAIKAEVDLQKPWVLIEKDDEFSLERTLEDHERVYVMSSRWPRTGQRKFLFRIDFKKNDMFENPEAYFPAHVKVAGVFLQQPAERVQKARQTFLKDYFQGIVRIPELETQCYLREKVKSWKKYTCAIRSSGLYYSKSKSKDSRKLVCYGKFNATDIFEAFGYKKMYKAPTDFVLAIRPETGMCANGMIKCIAFESRADLLSWKAAMRCAKYGMQLRENFELSQQRQMVINRMYASSQSAVSGELRSPQSARGGTMKLVPIQKPATPSSADSEDHVDGTAAGAVGNHDNEEEQIYAAAALPTGFKLEPVPAQRQRPTDVSTTTGDSVPSCHVVAPTPVEEDMARPVGGVHALESTMNGSPANNDMSPTKPQLITARPRPRSRNGGSVTDGKSPSPPLYQEAMGRSDLHTQPLDQPTPPRLVPKKRSSSTLGRDTAAGVPRNAMVTAQDGGDRVSLSPSPTLPTSSSSSSSSLLAAGGAAAALASVMLSTPSVAPRPPTTARPALPAARAGATLPAGSTLADVPPPKPSRLAATLARNAPSASPSPPPPDLPPPPLNIIADSTYSPSNGHVANAGTGNGLSMKQRGHALVSTIAGRPPMTIPPESHHHDNHGTSTQANGTTPHHHGNTIYSTEALAPGRPLASQMHGAGLAQDDQSLPPPPPFLSAVPPPPNMEPPPLPRKNTMSSPVPPHGGQRPAPVGLTSLHHQPPQPHAPPIPDTSRPLSQAQMFGPSAAPRQFQFQSPPPTVQAVSPVHSNANTLAARRYDQPQHRTGSDLSRAHMGETWFHGPLPRAAAENILRAAGGQNGMYLVRESSKVPGSYVLTMIAQSRIHNFHIITYSDEKCVAFGIDNSPRFATLAMLVEHFRQNSQRLPCSLTYYVERA